ncbi:uncharacterized protein LOC142985427 isoform X2 [Anticarsia gemmatalis]
MLAPDWESMQDWVTTLRNTLHELKILSKGENVYCVAPAPAPPPAPRAAARDPTSPLPPTPPTPPDRVPGIELAPNTRTPSEATGQPEATRQPDSSRQPETSRQTDSSRQTDPSRPSDLTRQLDATRQVDSTRQADTSRLTDISRQLDSTRPPETSRQQDTLPETIPEPQTIEADENIDISNWDSAHTFSSLPSTSQGRPEKPETRKGVTKICGQNICLDDSLFKRNTTESDEEFFAEIDRMSDDDEYTQRVLVCNGDKEHGENSNQATNITVIQVSNKDPPHTAIPVLGPENVFDFDFKQQLTITDPSNPNFVNIVNTETSEYGTTFSNTKESDYGHLSLTTTVNLTGIEPSATPSRNDEVYERLCLASTSNAKISPLPIKKLKKETRKSSLPNLEVESTYEYLFLSNNNTNTVNIGEVNCNGESRVQVNSGSDDARSVERSRSQNAYDATPRTREIARRVQNSPKREIRNESDQNQTQKPIWKRGLTELSLLTRLRSIGQNKKQSPTRQDDNHERTPAVTSPVKVVHRSRPEARVDSTRRRSSSLSNGQSPLISPVPSLITLRARQAASLRNEQRRGAALVSTISVRDAPVFADYDNQVWVSWWGGAAGRAGGKCGDRVAALRGRAPSSAAHAHALLAHNNHTVDILYHRVPLAKIYVINKRDQESIGLKLDSECNIVRVEPHSGAARAGLPPTGHWALTEINNRPINLLKGGEDDMNRLSRHGNEVSVLIQPSPLVKKLRAALKGHKTLLGLR